MEFLYEHFPRDPLYHFVDGFGGSGVVVLNSGDYRLKTYNDLNSELVNFFRQLRKNGRRLHREILLTPYSREEYKDAFSLCDDDFERARRFFVRTQMSRNGQHHQASVTGKVQGHFSYNITESRRRVPRAVLRYRTRAEALRETIDGFLDIQIENLPAIELINKYDNENTFFYLDPPYVHATRSNLYIYDHEMDDAAHRELGEVLNNAKGKVMVSGYQCELYDEIFKDWLRVDDTPYISPLSRKLKQESIWLNYDPPKKKKTPLGF